VGIRALVGEERSDLVALLRTLTNDEWDTPSLCTGWRVRDVVAHLLYDSMPVPRYFLGLVSAGFSPERMNARAVEQASGLETSKLVEALESSAYGVSLRR
jgi:uncharacterized protein (TIGR03083 family)